MDGHLADLRLALERMRRCVLKNESTKICIRFVDW
jgi:hypothetical protein